MLFSVVVPVYNIEQYIRQCIDTLINQSFEDYEIILVDDGSSDASGSICDEYAESHERVKVIHQENGGLVKARKVGAQTASGDYIIPVDGDDWVDAKKPCRHGVLQTFFGVAEWGKRCGKRQST